MKNEAPFEISLTPTNTTPLEHWHPVGVRTDIQLHIEAIWELINVLLNQLEIVQNKPDHRDALPRLNLRDAVRRFEIDLIQRALTRTRGSQVQAARFLGLNATTLNSKIKRYRLKSPFLIHSAPSPLTQPNTECEGA